MSTLTTRTQSAVIRIAHDELVDFATRVFVERGLPADRARVSAEALCHGDLTGVTSHGLTNLSRLYLKLFEDGRVNPAAEPVVKADRGAAVLIDADRALGLWMATEAMQLAAERAARYGVGLVSVSNSTHLGCLGFHTAHAADQQMIGVIASNCGGQRIIRPPGGLTAMLGTNPFSIASPAGRNHPFVLDMSTTVVPTGKVRAMERAGRDIPDGWLEDDAGRPVNDPAAFDRGDGHLMWLGGAPETGGYKGYGLGLLVEVLAALVPGAGTGPVPAALDGDGGPGGRDDDIGFLALAIAPGALRSGEDFDAQADALFGTLLGCPPRAGQDQVSYPGWPEAERSVEHRRSGVPVSAALHDELVGIARQLDLSPPTPLEGNR
ncbi:MAG: Ldh family oxidoreductase [Streptosporangiaceae bacterium]